MTVEEAAISEKHRYYPELSAELGGLSLPVDPTAPCEGSSSVEPVAGRRDFTHLRETRKHGGPEFGLNVLHSCVWVPPIQVLPWSNANFKGYPWFIRRLVHSWLLAAHCGSGGGLAALGIHAESTIFSTIVQCLVQEALQGDRELPHNDDVEQVTVRLGESCQHGPDARCSSCVPSYSLKPGAFFRPRHYYDRKPLHLTVRLSESEGPLVVPLWLGSWWTSEEARRDAAKASHLMSGVDFNRQPPGWGKTTEASNQWGYMEHPAAGNVENAGPDHVHIGQGSQEKWIRLTDRHRPGYGGCGEGAAGVIAWHETDSASLQHMMMCRAPPNSGSPSGGDEECDSLWDLVTEEGYLELSGSLLRGSGYSGPEDRPTRCTAPTGQVL